MIAEDLHLITGIGIGDHIIMYGIIKNLSPKYHNIYSYVCPENYDNIVRLYKSIINLHIVKTSILNNMMMIDQQALDQAVNLYDIVTKILAKDPSTIINDVWMYNYFDLPIEKKWEDFYIERDLEKEKDIYYNTLGLKDNEEFIFIHDDPYRGLCIDENKINKDIKHINPYNYQTISIFDFLYTIERAKEIHVIISSFFTLIDIMNIKNENIFCHKYLIKEKDVHGYGKAREIVITQYRSRLNWQIL